jgi:protein SCO1/2
MICPKMNQSMLSIEKVFLAIPIWNCFDYLDPAHDTPAVLKEHANLLGDIFQLEFFNG